MFNRSPAPSPAARSQSTRKALADFAASFATREVSLKVSLKPGDTLEVFLFGEWTKSELLAIDGAQYNVRLPDGAKYWMPAAQVRRAVVSIPAGQPPKPGLASCAGKIRRNLPEPKRIPEHRFSLRQSFGPGRRSGGMLDGRRQNISAHRRHARRSGLRHGHQQQRYVRHAARGNEEEELNVLRFIGSSVLRFLKPGAPARDSGGYTNRRTEEPMNRRTSKLPGDARCADSP